MMVAGFQSSGFQHPGFQGTATGGVVTPPSGQAIVGGGWQERRSGIYWPRKTKKRDELAIVAEVVAEALATVPAEVPRHIDVGVLAQELIQANTYQVLRQIDTYDQMIRLIKRELEEWDDEDALLLLL